MFAAVLGREAPQDLEAATADERSVVGVWAKAWWEKWAPGLPGASYEAFIERCVRDVGRKRGKSYVGDLGRVAMSKIVPGIWGAMRSR